MHDITHVGLYVHKAMVCVAVAESGRGGEVRQVRVFENVPRFCARLRQGLARPSSSFCHEAVPCGYGCTVG
jgi:hypothetical protein